MGRTTRRVLLLALGFTLALFCAGAELRAKEVLGGRLSLLIPDQVSEAARALLQEQVRQVLAQHQEELRQCYVKRRETQPTVRGALTLLFEITASGRAETPAVVASTLHDGQIEQCVVQAMQSWTFPKPVPAKIIVIYPVQFAPDTGGPASLPDGGVADGMTAGLGSGHAYPDAGIMIPGSLEKEAIRQVIRQHISEVRNCYENELVRLPNLAGRVMIQFVISAQGVVPASLVKASTLGNAVVEQCIVGAVRTWVFPKPVGGGTVTVAYPFVLRSAAEP